MAALAIGGLLGMKAGGVFNDNTSYTNQGNKYKVGDVATEGLSAGQDSLTQMLRSLSNLTGTKGNALLDRSNATFDAGMNAVGAGADTLNSGLAGFKAPQDYWSTLLSGDHNALAAKLAPETGTIVSQYDAGRKALSEFGARGGGTNSTLAALPQQQAGDINKLTQSVRPEAAQQLSQIAQVLSSLGLSQEQIGVTLGQLGLSQGQLGSTLLGQTIQNLLGRKGLNVQESSANKQLAASSAKTAVDALI